MGEPDDAACDMSDEAFDDESDDESDDEEPAAGRGRFMAG
jgi:hypothetical protein